MEEACVKENVPVEFDHKGVKSIKMSTSTPRELSIKSMVMTTSTPRQPLMDIQQIPRPTETCSIPVKSLNSLGTPKHGKIQKKLKPSSLLKNPNKENLTEQNGNRRSVETRLLTQRMDEIFEENVEEFVTKVLDQSVKDLEEEESAEHNIMETVIVRYIPEIEPQIAEDPTPDNTAVEHNSEITHDDDNDIDHSTQETGAESNETEDSFDKQADVDLSLSKEEGTYRVDRDLLVSQFGDVSVSEESLLGDSHYSDCSESFAESTKSEEELLASYIQTPHLDSAKSIVDENSAEKEMPSREFIMDGTRFRTPRTTFLENVAVVQRVKSATSSLASWVFPKGTMDHRLQRVPSGEKVRLMHDMACSPMPLSVVDIFPECCALNIENKEGVVNNSDDALICDAEAYVYYATEKVQSATGENLNNEESTQHVMEEANETEGEADMPNDMELVFAQEVPIGIEFCTSNQDENSDRRNSALEASRPSKIPSPIHHKAFNSIACSPINVLVCDFSVQNEIETQSAQCSPIKFSIHDVSIQNETEMHSAVCSPVRFPLNDISSQDPLRVQGQDISVQHEVATQSTMCSPMVHCPSEDKSVLISGPEVVEVGMMTVEKNFTDSVVQVQPDIKTVSTEMGQNPMTTTSTAMTPLKMDKKQGRKLTAEDVRRQHPRVLANELETLRLQNSRLESQVNSLQKDRMKLVAQEELQKKLHETKAALDEEQDKYKMDYEEWKTRLDKLEAHVSVLKLEHENKIREVRAEYASNDYKEHFYASQKLVIELQDDLDQYTQLVDDIDHAQNLQGQLEHAVSDGFMKVKRKAKWIMEQQRAIEIKNRELQKQTSQYNRELQTLEDDKSAIEKEREQMSEIVMSAKESMLQLDSQLQNCEAELGATKETVLTMREEMDALCKESEDVTSRNEVLLKENEKLKSAVEQASEEVTGLCATIKQQENHLNQLNKSLTETTEKLENETSTRKKTEESRELVVRNLERTLENREAEIDMLEKDLFECREVIYTQMEAAKDHDAKEKETAVEIESLKKQVDTLKDCCVNLRVKEQDARSTILSTEEELACSREYASKVMKQQGTEIADCSSAFVELVGHMTNVLSNLSRRAGIEEKSKDDENDEADVVTIHTDLSKCNKTAPTSLVSQILSAAKSFTESNENGTADIENNDVQSGCVESEKNVKESTHCRLDALSRENEVMDSPGALSRKKLGFSGNSAFAPIRSSKVLLSQQAGNAVTKVANSKSQKCNLNKLNTETMEYSKQKTFDGGSTSHHFHKKVESKIEGVCLDAQEVGLTNQMVRVTELFTETTRVAHLIEKALRSSLNDITFENEDLNSRVSQCEYSERRLQAELQVTQSELETSKNVTEQLNAKLQEMSEKFGSMLDQDLESKRLQDELSRLRGKFQAMEAEKDLLNEQITELLHRIETESNASTHGSYSVDAKSQREILALKRKLEKYRSLLNEKDMQVEQISSKASGRILKLEANWKKADAEVCRFDELVDIVRAVLVGHKTVMQDAKLSKLVELIDSREPLSSFEDERKRLDLKPVKTVKW